MDSRSPFVSVLTPFHNTQDYLAECIESVLKQTYDNWEYVLVNNCSTDRSVEIAEHYVRLHPKKLRLEHNKTLVPQVQNYNGALQLISPESKYCKIVQADDFLFPECLRLMVEAAEQDPTIGVVGSYSLEGRYVAFDGLRYPSTFVTGTAIGRLYFLEDVYLFGSATQLLLRSDLIRNRTPFYDETYIPFEDAVVAFELLTQSNFGFVHQVLTFTRRDNPSLMGRITNLDYVEPFNLMMLRELGRNYLNPFEYEEQLRKKERIYADVLVNRAICLRGKDFWNFHRGMLKRMGYSLKSPGVWRLLLLGLGTSLFSPKSAGNFQCGFQRLVGMAKRLVKKVFLPASSVKPMPSLKKGT
jgi:glycosyltransferase involved in cell wall biosynthesis